MNKHLIRFIALLFITFTTTECFGQSEAEKLNIQGNDFGRQGKYDEAIIRYDKAIELDPKYSEPFYNRGKAKLNLKNYIGAIDDFNKALKLDPNNSDIYNNRGIAKKKSNDLKGAIDDYDKSLTLDPTNYRVYFNRGIAKYEDGNKAGACIDFKIAKKYNIEGAESGLKQIGCN
jgi:tetratricopeptide (TPR) repeat protein